jgi:hypothetical protein
MGPSVRAGELNEIELTATYWMIARIPIGLLGQPVRERVRVQLGRGVVHDGLDHDLLGRRHAHQPRRRRRLFLETSKRRLRLKRTTMELRQHPTAPRFRVDTSAQDPSDKCSWYHAPALERRRTRGPSPERLNRYGGFAVNFDKFPLPYDACASSSVFTMC